MKRLHTLGALAALAVLAGCATLTDTDEEQILVQTIQDNREIAGVGCILENNMGRWFVVSPGYVTVRKSPGDLTVNCKKEGAGVANATVYSKANTTTLIGNVVITAGIGYLIDRRSGAGFDYPKTLPILMQSAAPPAATVAEPAGSVVY